MKNLQITILLSCLCFAVNAQKIIEKNIAYNNQTIDLDVAFASEITVNTWNKNEVYFKAIISTKKKKYLDLYQLKVIETKNLIAFTSDTDAIFKAKRKDLKYQNNIKGHYVNTDDDYEFNYILYVPKNSKFKISSINGNLKSERIEGNFEADLINGDIEIEKYAGDLELNTINGEIDLKMIDAHLVAETIHGDIYADENLKFTVNNRTVGQKISGTTGKGSNILYLNTINGNMYFRE